MRGSTARASLIDPSAWADASPRVPPGGWAREHGLGRLRWVAERTLAWLGQFRCLRIRYERRPEIHEALLTIGCSLICWNFTQHGFC